MMHDYRFEIGPVPIIVTAISIYVYGQGLLIRKNDVWKNIASTFFISSFLVAFSFYSAGVVSTLRLVASQITATALFFLLMKIAIVYATEGPRHVLVRFEQSVRQFLIIALLVPLAILGADYFIAHIAPRCVGSKCFVFEFLFGFDPA
jgi:hypothetical protein